MKNSRLFKWRNFRSHVSEICKVNYAWDRFTDMTFIVEKRRVTAHKIILSANSEFFKMILNEAPSCVHPTITLPDVNFEDLDAIIKFIYTGELLVHPDRLESVLSLASCFQVKSLMKVQAALIKEGNETTEATEAIETTETTERIDNNTCDVSSILGSSLQNHQEVAPPDILPSSSQHQSKPPLKPKKKVKNSQKTERKNNSKGNLKKLVAKQKVGKTKKITAADELKKMRGRKCSISKKKVLVAGKKSNRLNLTLEPLRGPRFNNNRTKEKLLKEFEKGKSARDVAKLFNMSLSTAFYYKRSFLASGKLSQNSINLPKGREYENTDMKKVARKTLQKVSPSALLLATFGQGDGCKKK